MVIVTIAANYIDSKPMKNRSEDKMIRLYQVFFEKIVETGVCIPKTHILDNEASYGFKTV